MRLYLVQHGEAEPKEVNADRPLTEKGKADSARTAEFMKKSGIKPHFIWHSAKLRAEETAKIFSDRLKPVKGLERREGLAPNDPVNEVFSLIESHEEDIMLVGHMPFLQKLASLLITGDESVRAVKFTQGGVVGLEKSEANNWQVIFSLSADIIS